MEDDGTALLPFRPRPPRGTERLHVAPPDDPLDLFAPEPAPRDAVRTTTTPKDSLDVFPAEPSADQLRAQNPSSDSTWADTAVWILIALEAIGLIAAIIYFAQQ